MPITATGDLDPQVYVVPDDVTETQPDGRVVQVAAKGSALPLVQAQALGLVKVTQSVRPTESKEAAPAERKSAPPPATEPTTDETPPGGK